MENGLDYELIDFGAGRKLERFGDLILNRPEILADSKPGLSVQEWNKRAHGKYFEHKKSIGEWKKPNSLPQTWNCKYQSLKSTWNLELSPGKYKHVGVFPEQEKHWKYLEENVKPGDRVLTLFGYTGASSLVASKMGGDVFHVDSSKSVVTWAARNAALSGIDNIHWVCDDALKFAERQERRNHKYDFIIMDPPVFGQGKKGQRWKLEDLLPQLVDTTASILSQGGALILNTYSPVVSLEQMENLMKKTGISCINKGWLNVMTKDGRKLALSKFTIAVRR